MLYDSAGPAGAADETLAKYAQACKRLAKENEQLKEENEQLQDAIRAFTMEIERLQSLACTVPFNEKLTAELRRLRTRLRKAGDHPLVMEEGGTDGVDRCHRVINKQQVEIKRLQEENEDFRNFCRDSGEPPV